jgi:uncharacterized Zn finger protein
MGWYEFRPYVPVRERQAEAAKFTAKLQKQGRKITPVKIEGRAIASTFWGKAWCDHLESYSDFANRLPRGRTYVRNGSVVDLQIKPGKITALVSGSEVYEITIKIGKLAPQRWKAVRSRCAGQVGSVLELLQGRFDKSVMEVLTHRDKGLFPAPAEIDMECSCPDWAGMCKHLAAVLYGVGSRLDHEPELLFVLRQVDHTDLLDQVTAGSLVAKADDGQKTLEDSELAGVFGIELDTTPTPEPPPARSARRATKTVPAAVATRSPKTTRSASVKGTKRGGSAAKSSKTTAKPKATAKPGTVGRGKKPR